MKRLNIILLSILLIFSLAGCTSEVYGNFGSGSNLGVNVDSTWDGESADISWYNDNQDNFSISKASELAGLAQLVNGGEINFAGKTITLESDIDLNGKNWMPIGSQKDKNVTHTFNGIFDGKGHVISNLTINDVEKTTNVEILTESATNETRYGLFGSTYDATIKNLTLENVNIDVSEAKGNIVPDAVGSLIGFAIGDLTVDNVKVSGTVKGLDGVGGVIGRIYGLTPDVEKKATLTNITNEAKVIGTAKIGGIVSHIYGGGIKKVDGKNVTCNLTFKISNSKNSGAISTPDDHASNGYLGGIVGYDTSTNSTFENVLNTGAISGMGVTVRVGGIIGSDGSRVNISISNSESNGNLSANYSNLEKSGVGIYIGGLFQQNSGASIDETNKSDLIVQINNANIDAPKAIGNK